MSFIVVLTFFEGVLFRTKNFRPDYRYTENFVDNTLVDEIVLIDVSNSKNNRNLFYDVLKRISKSCFVPITVGGYINDVEEITKFQNVSRWYKQISQRSAVLKGYDIPETGAKIPII